ncbi:MAG: lysylphosphatidylglycerol synthase domain-containing protein [Gemmatimonadales bacterium]
MHRRWVVVGQLLLAVALVLTVGRSVVDNWTDFQSLGTTIRPRPFWIGLAALTVWMTYALLIEAWRQILKGWDQQLGYLSAVRVWCLSNLGRYLPGKLWSIAALAMLAQRRGVKGWAAASSAVAMQALAVGTGAVIVAVGAPGAASPLQLAAAITASVAAIAILAYEPLAANVVRLVKPAVSFESLPIGTALAASAVTLLSWVSYGIAFWLLAVGLFGPNDLTVLSAIGIFGAGYIVGLLALFAPGGLGVRELVFVAMLSPAIGSTGALALSIGSRLLLTGTEVGAALFALWLSKHEENAIVGSP